MSLHDQHIEFANPYAVFTPNNVGLRVVRKPEAGVPLSRRLLAIDEIFVTGIGQHQFEDLRATIAHYAETLRYAASTIQEMDNVPLSERAETLEAENVALHDLVRRLETQLADTRTPVEIDFRSLQREQRRLQVRIWKHRARHAIPLLRAKLASWIVPRAVPQFEE